MEEGGGVSLMAIKKQYKVNTKREWSVRTGLKRENAQKGIAYWGGGCGGGRWKE